MSAEANGPVVSLFPQLIFMLPFSETFTLSEGTLVRVVDSCNLDDER